MADWKAIEAVGLTLKALIERRMNEEFVSPQVRVQLVTPASFETLDATDRATISLFLYRIVENTELRNQLPTHMTSGASQRQPLTLELGYLVTAWAARSTASATVTDEQAAREEHQLLGLVLQAMAEHAEISGAELVEDDPANPVFASTDNLQVVLESMPLEDIYRIWDASELPYRLSLTYRVRVLGIDPHTSTGTPRVEQGDFHYGEGAA